MAASSLKGRETSSAQITDVMADVDIDSPLAQNIVTTADTFSWRSILTATAYCLLVAIAVLIATSWNSTLSALFAKLGLSPTSASWIGSIVITFVGVLLTILLNRIVRLDTLLPTATATATQKKNKTSATTMDKTS